MTYCPNCGSLVETYDDLRDEDRARFDGYVSGRGGHEREPPDENVEEATSNFGIGKRREINHQWLIGYDAGASVRASIEATP